MNQRVSHSELRETTTKILMLAGRHLHAVFLQMAGYHFTFFKSSVKMTPL